MPLLKSLDLRVLGGCAADEALLTGGLRPPATILQPYGLRYSSNDADPIAHVKVSNHGDTISGRNRKHEQLDSTFPLL